MLYQTLSLVCGIFFVHGLKLDPVSTYHAMGKKALLGWDQWKEITRWMMQKLSEIIHNFHWDIHTGNIQKCINRKMLQWREKQTRIWKLYVKKIFRGEPFLYRFNHRFIRKMFTSSKLIGYITSNVMFWWSWIARKLKFAGWRLWPIWRYYCHLTESS
jgi:hypothetical protein